MLILSISSRLYYDDEDTHSDDESRLAVATMWGLNWGRRGSVGVGAPAAAAAGSGGKPQTEQKDRLALDISLLKKQYDRLRERQKQAHVILTTACSTATATRQAASSPAPAAAAVPVNQLLLGRPAIVTNKGKRVGAPLGAIPPARKPSLPAVLHSSSKPAERQLRRGETLLWRDTDSTRHRRDSLTWKEIKADRAAMLREGTSEVKSQKLRSRLGKSDSSSYSEESDGEQQAVDGKDGSSTDTSLCDDDDPKSMEKSPKRKAKLARKQLNEKSKPVEITSREASLERRRPKSWAPSTHEIPFVLMGTDSGDEKESAGKEEEDSATESDRFGYARDSDWSRAAGDLAYSKLEPLHVETSELAAITSTSQLSPLPDIANYLSTTSISPLPTPKPIFVMCESEMTKMPHDHSSLRDDPQPAKRYDVSDAGVTNQYFERVNSVERPSRLELSYSLNDDEMEAPDVKEDQQRLVEGQCEGHVAKGIPLDFSSMGERDDNIPGENKDDYKEVLSMTIEETQPAQPAQPVLPATSLSRKRRDPRRKTLTRSSTIEIEERFQALERRLSQEQPVRTSDVRLERTKFIPTTESLEERYNTLEKQLSSEKQQQQHREDAVCLDKQPSENIPSTADLEMRFNALTKQLSSSESNNTRSPVELSGQDESSQGSGGNSRRGKDSNETSRSEQAKVDAVNQPAKVETSPKEEDRKKEEQEEERPRLKKLPSTAELEDRFNALERKMSVQKSNLSKAKDKPPDECLESGEEPEKPSRAEVSERPEEKPKTKSEEKSKTQPEEKSKTQPEEQSKTKPEEKSKTNPEEKPQEKPKQKTEEKPKDKSDKKPETPQPQNGKIIDPKSVPSKAKEPQQKIEIKAKLIQEKPSKKAEESKENVSRSEREEIPKKSPTKPTKVEQVKPVEQTEKQAEVKQVTEVAKRKTPPSTEELEKRFNALEKQLSTSQMETDPKKEGDKKQEKAQSSMKSFDAKVKEISASLKVEETAEDDESGEVEERQSKTEEIKKPEEKKESTSESPKQSSEQSEPEQTQSKELSKRRASEPPSMEDLDKRYERLKRRMSSRNQLTNQNETVNEALERIEQEVMAELGDTEEGQEEEDEVPKAATRRQTPPTTEDLESRYEALHKEKPSTAGEESEEKPKSSTAHHVDVAIEAHIPDAPPPPPTDMMTLPAAGQRQQQALIEELQSKMRGQSPGEENLKPSEINPQRRRRQQQRPLQQRPTPMGDETSEAPANTAYYRSGNYEPWPGGQRMVRRFSDLPSRADLENRLQFLERKLYKRFYKQRCASDSEVASRQQQQHDDQPSTSRHAEAQLEQRVLALEKQLSENSLKLLEAMREKVALTDAEEIVSSPARRLSSDSETTQGKELVRYTQNLGELEESSDKPINISINIKMLLNKEAEQKKPPADSSSTEDLRRRLEQLEQQLLEERARHAAAMQDCELLTAEPSAVEEPAEMEVKIEDGGKQEKDSHNQSVKHVEAEKMEEEEQVTPTPSEPEALKESKTLQNEERAQTRIKAALEEDREGRKGSSEIEVIEKPKEGQVDKEEAPLPAQNPLPTQAEQEQPPVETKQAGEDAKSVQPGDDKTVVLLMDNEPRALKVRRLTRANTEELEGLFQALEKQLNDRNLVKSKDGKLVRAAEPAKPSSEQLEQAQAISDLTKEIEDFTAGPKPEEEVTKSEAKEAVTAPEEDPNYDWGPNPVKHHLKRKTVYLPSTKELEARFRSLERQIKLLEDVEKIDVEQRLNEIERKIKLQYSLSHEKDLNKYIELCEGKGLDDEQLDEKEVESAPVAERSRSRSPARKDCGKSSPYTSPGRKAASTVKSPKSPYVSPSRRGQKTPPSSHTSPARKSPARREEFPYSDDLEYKYRVLDLVRSKSKEQLAKRKQDPNKKPPIHPLEMLLDPSPDSSEIPTTGELEHRIRLLDEKLKTPASTAAAPTRSKSRSRSPTIDDIKRQKMLSEQRPRTPVHSLERMVYSPDRPEPPTAAELEQRMLALEQEQSFDFKTQKDYKEFNQKLKDVVSPSYEEFMTARSREQSPRRAGTPKSAMRRCDNDTDEYRERSSTHYRPTSPKVIRFRDEDDDEQQAEQEEPNWRSTRARHNERMVGKTNEALNGLRENTKILQRILAKTLADQSASSPGRSSSAIAAASSMEGLDAFGSRLMRVRITSLFLSPFSEHLPSLPGNLTHHKDWHPHWRPAAHWRKHQRSPQFHQEQHQIYR